MYAVSDEYIAKLKEIGVKRRKIRGTLGGVSFTENDILKDSLQYSDIAVSSSDIKLGGVFIGSLKLTFLDSFAKTITRGTWRGKVVNVEIGLLAGDSYEYVPLKPFVIDEANHSALGVDVTAYDYMSRFDATIAMNTTSGNLYGFAVTACAYCGVEFGMTADEVNALPNGDQILGLYPDNDIETWRDLLSWIGVTIGGFATINRDGKLVFRNWTQEPVIEIGKNDRFKGGTWSDFETYYSAIKITNIEDGTVGYYSVPDDTGLTLDLGANPLLQYGVDSVKTQQRTNILNAVQNLKYVPFKSQSFIDPCIDLGDVISYTDGLASEQSLCCVMRIDFQYSKGTTLQGYGKNPSLNGARSKADKEIAAAASNNKNNGLTYYTYLNTTAVEIGTVEKRVYRIAFATAEQTTVEIWHEVKALTEFADDTQSVTFRYYYDGVLIDYEPEDTVSEADKYHIFKGDYWLLNVAPGEVHYWEVRAFTDNGTATVGIGDVHAMIKGQKMAAQVAFDGNLELTDEITPYQLGFDIVALEDRVVSIDTQEPKKFGATDTIQAYKVGVPVIGLSDSMTLTATAVQYTRVTEDSTDDDEISRITEDGGTRLTEV